MTDFLITQMTLYPWFTWLLVVFVVAGVAWWSVLLAHGVMFVSDWAGYRRKDWRWKAAVRNVGENGDHLCPSCMVMAERTGDDPPEYQHPDGDDDELPSVMPWLEEVGLKYVSPRDELAKWEADEDADEFWAEEMAGLATVLRMAHEKGILDAEWETDLRRCDNEDCGLHGMLHNGPCDLEEPKYLEGAAMPPQPVREYLHPAIMDDLAARGFSEHETNDGAVDSMFTRSQVREVQAMITDGIIPVGEIGKGQDDDSD